MLRSIPLPDESVPILKARYGLSPLLEIQLRMRIWEIDRNNGLIDTDYQLANDLAIEDILLDGDWPEC